MTDTINAPNTTQQANTQPEDNGPAGKMFTQEEVNSIIRDRIARERAKYADYDALKAKAQQFDAAQEAGKTELQKANEKATRLQDQLDNLTKANTLRDIRSKVSSATGVPAELLSGDTEEACTAQAKAIIQFAKPGYPNVQDGGEPNHAPSVPNMAAAAFDRDRKHKPKEFNPYF